MQKNSSKEYLEECDSEVPGSKDIYYGLHPACLDPFLLQEKIITVKHRATGNFFFELC